MTKVIDIIKLHFNISFSFLIFVAIHFYVPSVSAQSLDLEQFKEKISIFSGEFSLTGNVAVEDVGDVVGNNYFGDLNLNYSEKGSYNFDLKMRYNDANAFMFSVTEANGRYEFLNGRLTLGRVILNWSDLDANWGFGRINNRINFDFFEPGEEGLTGLSYDAKFGGLLLSVFASYLYIPELNPGQKYDKDEGTIKCNNPWCRPVPEEDDGTGLGIVYDLDVPDISDIVFNYSFGTKIGGDFGFGKASGFYMRKPENQISVSANIQVDTGGSTAIIDAQLNPEVYYHEVWGANIEFDLSDELNIHGSFVGYYPDSQPEGSQDVFDYLKRKTLKIDEEYLGGGATYKKDNYKAEINYIARISEFEVDKDKLVEYPRWNQAIHASFVSQLNTKLSLGLDYKYDMLTEDRLGMIKANYLYNQSLVFGAGINVIGENSDKESYWSAFSNNDSVYGSVKYTF